MSAGATWRATGENLLGALPAIVLVFFIGLLTRRRVNTRVARMLKGAAFTALAFVAVQTFVVAFLRSLSLRTNLGIEDLEILHFGVIDAWFATLKGAFIGATMTMALDAPPLHLWVRRKDSGESANFLDDAGASGKILLVNWVFVLGLVFALILVLS